MDALGRGALSVNPILATQDKDSGLTFSVESPGHFAYRRGKDGEALWTIECSEKTLKLRSHKGSGDAAPPFELVFDQKANHATLLGLMKRGERRVQLPAVLHLPDLGSVRIRSTAPAALDYDARRYWLSEDPKARPFVKVSFPAASGAQTEIEYVLEIAAIHPPLSGIEADPLFDGFRRSFLNIFQLNPHVQMLTNNASSDPCAFTVYQYAEVARRAPALVDGLHPLDLVRMTLDRYLEGGKGYGQVGFAPTDQAPDLGRWKPPYNSLDALPSLLLSACYYAEAKNDWEWARQNYPALARWGREIFAGDTDGNGLIEYPQSGNSISHEKVGQRNRPSNWWDTIMFGHEDAWANALAYRAATAFAKVAARLEHADDAQFFTDRAAKLRAAYVPAFLNPKTGVLAGWKSADGKLHDYYFTFVNGTAITYGLVDAPLANTLMDRILAEMKQVGFHAFQYGLPGNLIPIRREDHFKHTDGPRWGEPQLEDGSDGFQVYENGGASACHAYFTYHALYQLGRTEDARRLFLPTLRNFAEGGFQGFDTTGMSFDWRDWSGRGHGYEGFLVDNYFALLAAFDEYEARSREVPGGTKPVTQ